MPHHIHSPIQGTKSKAPRHGISPGISWKPTWWLTNSSFDLIAHAQVGSMVEAAMSLAGVPTRPKAVTRHLSAVPDVVTMDGCEGMRRSCLVQVLFTFQTLPVPRGMQS